MIETRSGVPGFYKGFIYCSSLEEAYEIADYVDVVIQKRFGSKLPLIVKRGCSEYSAAFPDYDVINKPESQLMNYNEEWELIEEEFDSKNPTKYKRNTRPSLCLLALSDVLIMRNWVDYAEGIGDTSARLLDQHEVVSQKVYKIARARQETHPWQESG